MPKRKGITKIKRIWGGGGRIVTKYNFQFENFDIKGGEGGLNFVVLLSLHMYFLIPYFNKFLKSKLGWGSILFSIFISVASPKGS